MELYTPVHARLCRYVQSFVWQQDDAKDLVSEITLLAFERFYTIKDKDRFAFFLFGIARNLYLKKIRRNKFKISWNEDSMHAMQGNQHADDRLKKIELANLLNKLPPSQSEAISLFEVAGFSYEEIAVIQNTTMGSVKSSIYKGRQALKEMILKENERVQFVSASHNKTKLKMDGLL